MDLSPVLQPEAWQILQGLSQITDFSPAVAEKLDRSLRMRGIDGQTVAAILTQLELRSRARTKFGQFASGMLFTRDGLEQASRLELASRHAAKFRKAGCAKVADLGCGIGTQSLALAGLGILVRAFDIDEASAAAALMNLRAFPEAKVEQSDVTKLDFSALAAQGVDGLWADPARRNAKGRVCNPQNWSPPLPWVRSLRSDIANLGIKVAPGINYEALDEHCLTEFISVDGNLLEAVVWYGKLRQMPADFISEAPSGRLAVVATSPKNTQERWAWHYLSDPSCPKANEAPRKGRQGDLGKYLHEPDAAVIRSGTLAALLEKVGGTLISPQIAYFCTSKPIDTPFARSWEVLETCPMQIKKVREALAGLTRSLGPARLEVKKRGADIDPAGWQKILDTTPTQEQRITVFATRIGSKHQAIIARPL